VLLRPDRPFSQHRGYIFAVKLTLAVHYTPGYPDELPELALKSDDLNLDEEDEKKLLASLLKVVCCLSDGLVLLDFLSFRLLGHRKLGNGNDIYFSIPSKRGDWCVNSREDRIREEDRSRERETSVRGTFFLLKSFLNESSKLSCLN